jgi:hypothetical protein
MASESNVNLNQTLFSGNTGTIGTFPELGIIETVVLAPKGTVIPASAMVSQSAFATYVNGKFVNDTQSSQWYAFMNLDKFTDETKKTATEDTGRLNLSIYSFPNKFSFRYMQGMGNFIEATNFNNCQGQFDVFFIDDTGNWHGTLDVTGGTRGLAAYTLQQFFVPNSMRKTTSTGNQYMIEIQLADPTQMNGNFKLYQANTQADALVMLQNAFLLDVSDVIIPAVTTTTISFTMKSGQDSFDVVKAYTSVLTAACFVAYNLTTGSAATIASITKGTSVVAGETYYWIKAVLSVAPTSGDIVRISLAAPSVVNAIIPNFNMVSLPLSNQNGANCAVHTFA